MPPNVLPQGDDHFRLPCNRIAVEMAGETALRRDAESVQADMRSRILDASCERTGIFQLSALDAHGPQYHGCGRCGHAKHLEPARPRGIKLQKNQVGRNAREEACQIVICAACALGWAGARALVSLGQLCPSHAVLGLNTGSANVYAEHCSWDVVARPAERRAFTSALSCGAYRERLACDTSKWKPLGFFLPNREWPHAVSMHILEQR
jgi:hypothetical protein